jgi:hypothetical protein
LVAFTSARLESLTGHVTQASTVTRGLIRLDTDSLALDWKSWDFENAACGALVLIPALDLDALARRLHLDARCLGSFLSGKFVESEQGRPCSSRSLELRSSTLPQSTPTGLISRQCVAIPVLHPFHLDSSRRVSLSRKCFVSDDPRMQGQKLVFWELAEHAHS